MSKVACYGACVHTTEWDREALRKTLREIMERTQLSQTAIGRIAGRDRTMANRWASGRSRPTFEAAAALAAAIRQEHPDLADRLLEAAGYREPAHDRSPPTVTPDPARQLVDNLREIARREAKTIGDVLVERGLATPEDLTLSDQKKDDPLVREILESDLSEETKNHLLMEYVERRRINFRQSGVREDSELTQEKPRGM